VLLGHQQALAQKKLRVELQVPADLPSLTVDEPKFRRVFDLLFRDEIVSLPAGSQVTVCARAAQGAEGLQEIEIEVRDDGPGLPQEALRLLFDPFALRSDSPLEYGINLMAVYFIVHHHGGRISAHNANAGGKGTVFTLSFPLDCDQPPRVEEETQFLRKVMLNEQMWEGLATSF
jgi:two-component system probable response regulator PhcQ